MALNIKNERTVALVRELADLTGESMTSAIEQAIAARLEALKAQREIENAAREREARNAKARELLEDLRLHMPPSTLTAREMQNELYDEWGLPK